MSRRDEDLDRLLDLDGFLAEVGGGFWMKIVARRVPPDVNRPHGVTYTRCGAIPIATRTH